MMRFRSSLKLALPLGIALLASTALTQVAFAGGTAGGSSSSGGNTASGSTTSNSGSGWTSSAPGGKGGGLSNSTLTSSGPSATSSDGKTGYDSVGGVSFTVIGDPGVAPEGDNSYGAMDGNYTQTSQTTNDDGSSYSVTTTYQDDDDPDKTVTVTTMKNGVLIITITYDDAEDPPAVPGDTNDAGPDDTGKGSDKPNVASLIKSGQITLAGRVKGSVENSPLGSWLTQEGFGFDPRGNPGDNDTGNGPAAPPSRGSTGLTVRQLASLHQLENAAERTQTMFGLSMGSGEEGGSESAPVLNMRGSGSGKNGNGDDNSSKPKHVMTGEKLGPRPALVNPAPRVRSAGRVASSSATSTSGTSRAMQSGLLEGGVSSLGSNAPSGTGSFGGGSAVSGRSGPAALR